MRASRLVFAAALSAAIASPLAAQGGPVQLSLFNPVQLVKESQPVTAVRLNILYTRNTAVRYVDLGMGYNRTTGGASSGIQWAAVTWNDGTFSGWQSGIVAINKGMFTGLQSGGVTSARQGKGVQWGFINTAEHWNGLQLGVVNYTQRLHGVQVGLVNVIKVDGFLPVFPIVNWSF